MRKIALLIVFVCIFLTACTFEAEQEVNQEINQETNQEVSQESDKGRIETKIMPLPSTINVNNLTDSTVAVSLKKEDVYVDDSGIMQMNVTIYDYDLYDMVDISQLKEGDVIVIGKKDVIISSLERNSEGTVIINGGLEQGGYELVTDESGVFYENGYNGAKSYYSVGEATIRVSTEFEYCDMSKLDSEEKCYYPGDFLIDDAGIEYNFTPHNTSIIIQDGQIIAMNRVYVP